MGNRLVRECAARFAHLNGNPYKALMWMCLRTLDDPDTKKAIPAGLWFADWSELATAMGWQARLDAAAAQPTSAQSRDATKMIRDDVGKVCRELVAAGAIKKVPHPSRIDNAAYLLVLDPKPVIKQERGRRRHRVTAPVDNVLLLDFGTVDTNARGAGENHLRGAGENHLSGTGENHLRGAGENHLRGTGENHLPPTNRNQEQVQEQAQEGVQEKTDDDTTRRPQVPDRARPVDNFDVAARWAAVAVMAGAKVSAAARHARPDPPPIVRPDRE